MSVVIHDDFWEAAQALPEKQRAPFLYALLNYRFTGEEPKGKPAWLPMFIITKGRLDMADAASNRGKEMAEARWAKERAQAAANNDAQAMPEQCTSICTSNAAADAQADAQAYAQASGEYTCTDDAQASKSTDAEKEIEIELENNPPKVPPMDDVTAEPFALQCLAAFNEIMGTPYLSLPTSCARNLKRFEETYTLDEVRAMINYKREEWKGTRYEKALTPNTLFSRDHFEQYIQQSKGDAKEVSAYDNFDA